MILVLLVVIEAATTNMVPQSLGVVGLERLSAGVTHQVQHGDFIFLTGDAFIAVDVSDPLQPREVDTVYGRFWGLALDSHATFAYTIMGTQLRVLNISNPYNLKILKPQGFQATWGYALACQGETLYVGAQKFDITEPETPRLVSPFDPESCVAAAVVTSSATLYFSCKEVLYYLVDDVQVVQVFNATSHIVGIALDERRKTIYVSLAAPETQMKDAILMLVLDITVPKHPVLVSDVSVARSRRTHARPDSHAPFLSGENEVLLASEGAIFMVNTTNLANPFIFAVQDMLSSVYGVTAKGAFINIVFEYRALITLDSQHSLRAMEEVPTSVVLDVKGQQLPQVYVLTNDNRNLVPQSGHVPYGEDVLALCAELPKMRLAIICDEALTYVVDISIASRPTILSYSPYPFLGMYGDEMYVEGRDNVVVSGLEDPPPPLRRVAVLESGRGPSLTSQGLVVSAVGNAQALGMVLPTPEREALYFHNFTGPSISFGPYLLLLNRTYFSVLNLQEYLDGNANLTAIAWAPSPVHVEALRQYQNALSIVGDLVIAATYSAGVLIYDISTIMAPKFILRIGGPSRRAHLINGMLYSERVWGGWEAFNLARNMNKPLPENSVFRQKPVYSTEKPQVHLDVEPRVYWEHRRTSGLTLPSAGQVSGMQVLGSLLLILEENQLFIYSAASPLSPRFLSFLTVPGTKPSQLRAAGSYVWISMPKNNSLVDISNPSNPVLELHTITTEALEDLSLGMTSDGQRLAGCKLLESYYELRNASRSNTMRWCYHDANVATPLQTFSLRLTNGALWAEVVELPSEKVVGSPLYLQEYVFGAQLPQVLVEDSRVYILAKSMFTVLALPSLDVLQANVSAHLIDGWMAGGSRRTMVSGVTVESESVVGGDIAVIYPESDQLTVRNLGLSFTPESYTVGNGVLYAAIEGDVRIYEEAEPVEADILWLRHTPDGYRSAAFVEGIDNSLAYMGTESIEVVASGGDVTQMSRSGETFAAESWQEDGGLWMIAAAGSLGLRVKVGDLQQKVHGIQAALDLARDGSVLYVVDAADNLFTVRPTGSVFSTNVTRCIGCFAVEVQEGGSVWVLGDGGMLSQLTFGTLHHHFSIPHASAFVARNGLLYIAGKEFLRIYEVSEGTPVQIGELSQHSLGLAFVHDVEVAGLGTVLLATDNGLWVVNASDPSAPFHVTHIIHHEVLEVALLSNASEHEVEVNVRDANHIIRVVVAISKASPATGTPSAYTPPTGPPSSSVPETGVPGTRAGETRSPVTPLPATSVPVPDSRTDTRQPVATGVPYNHPLNPGEVETAAPANGTVRIDLVQLAIGDDQDWVESRLDAFMQEVRNLVGSSELLFACSKQGCIKGSTAQGGLEEGEWTFGVTVQEEVPARVLEEHREELRAVFDRPSRANFIPYLVAAGAVLGLAGAVGVALRLLHPRPGFSSQPHLIDTEMSESLVPQSL